MFYVLAHDTTQGEVAHLGWLGTAEARTLMILLLLIVVVVLAVVNVRQNTRLNTMETQDRTRAGEHERTRESVNGTMDQIAERHLTLLAEIVANLEYAVGRARLSKSSRDLLDQVDQERLTSNRR